MGPGRWFGGAAVQSGVALRFATHFDRNKKAQPEGCAQKAEKWCTREESNFKPADP